MSFSNRWIKSLLENMEKDLHHDTRMKVLEDCGRSCCDSSGYSKKARACASEARDVDDFLDRLSRAWSHMRRDGDKIYVEYEKCYCPLGRALLEEGASSLNSFCNCSVGWVKEMFEASLKRPVRVELEKSILRRDDSCRFKVYL